MKFQDDISNMNTHKHTHTHTHTYGQAETNMSPTFSQSLGHTRSVWKILKLSRLAYDITKPCIFATKLNKVSMHSYPNAV